MIYKKDLFLNDAFGFAWAKIKKKTCSVKSDLTFVPLDPPTINRFLQIITQLRKMYYAGENLGFESNLTFKRTLYM